ncbi:histidine phosphotransferase [Terrihabitans soli]|uniref:Histidine phosphotransferase n=1 Tax=Terrihabitans soli TaxID=708113 RepID=A0A6S6QM24_9HYPH|nr:histidine phosphotransferase family protein [Terrihabitans soli]BCJ89969.1 histidine phosphotransferase [Terrihabitans soli]
MSTPIELASLDLAALIASRLCHDVISPVGAIVNGLEVLEEEKDPAMREIALDLVRKSAEQASARLQFARLAFGAAGSAGAQIDVGDAEQVAQGIVRDAKAEMSWSAPRVLLPKNKVKLLLNMLVIAMSTVPRGGTITVTVEGNEPDTVFKIVTTGPMVRVAAGVVELLAGTPADGRVDAHVIQPFYTGLVAREAGMSVSIDMEGETVVLHARTASV